MCDAVSYVLGVYIIRESHTGEYLPGEYLSFFFARRGFHLRDTRVASLPLPVACCTLSVCTFAREEVPKQTDEDEYLDCDYGSVTVSVSAYAAHDARREAKQQLANVPVPPHRA